MKIALLIGLGIALFYWFKFSPIDIVEHKVVSGPILSEVMGTGTLEARISATISPKISGRIEEVLFDQGDKVQAGDLLVRLDDAELMQQVAIAQANLDASDAAITRLETDKSRANAVVIQARKLNQRRQELVATRAVSQEEVDAAVESLGVAEAGLSRAEAAIAEGQKELVAAEKTLEYHRARLADTRITAPFDGLIVRRYRESGDVVVPGSAILSLISTNELWISAWVDETEMEKVKSDQPARVVFRSDPNRSYAGSVARLGREADRETREFIVDVRVLELPSNWAVGQRAEVFIESASKESATLLPARFIELRDMQPGVFLNDNGYARWQAVEIGLRSPTHLEIAKGLQVGQTVVTPQDESLQLRDGRRITHPMNLAVKDIRHNLGRFVLTALGIGLLLMIVMGMGGIYRGIIEDATLLPRPDRCRSVDRATRYQRALRRTLPSVARIWCIGLWQFLAFSRAREFVYHTIQRERNGKPLRMAVLGLSWPIDKGEWIPLIAGRPLGQNHFEMIADQTLGFQLGERIKPRQGYLYSGRHSPRV